MFAVSFFQHLDFHSYLYTFFRVLLLIVLHSSKNHEHKDNHTMISVVDAWIEEEINGEEKLHMGDERDGGCTPFN